MNRKRWIAGAVLLILLTILSVSGLIIVGKEWKSPQGQIGYREPLQGFGYCSSSPIRPCILSFSYNPDGTMLISILAKGYAEDFYIKIRQAEEEYIYTCRKDEQYSIRVFCTGESLPMGETFSFLIVSRQGNSPLAEGSFPVIGVALATPEIRMTPTPVSAFNNLPK